MATHTTLKGFDHWGDSLLSEQLETNLVSFFNWGLLGKGAFFNVNIPASGAYGGLQHRLRLVDDPNYEDGQIWEGFRQDWVWESGVEYDYQPIQISGVFVNGGFHNISETGSYAHHINYPLGRVVFDTAIAASSLVTCEFSYRAVHFTTADVPWWREVQKNSFRVDDQFLTTSSGNWDILAQNRIQLPAVIIEAVPQTQRTPFQVGDLTAIVNQDVLFHVVSETPWERKHIHDIITYQWHKRIQGFDRNLLLEEDAFPLDYRGMPVSGAIQYPDLVKATGDGGFYWNQIRFEQMRSVEQNIFSPLYYCTVRGTFGVDLP